MKTYTPNIPRALCVALAVFTLGSSNLISQAPAENASAPPTPGTETEWIQLTFTTLKPEMIGEYNRLQREEVVPALKKAGVTAHFAYSPGMFAERFVVVTASPFKSFAEFDQESPTVRALGREAANALTEKIRACTVHSRVVAVRNFPDLCWGPATPMPKLVIISYELAPGRKAEWLAFMREHYVPAVKGTGVKSYIVQETVYGGSLNQVHTLAGFDTYADLDGGDLRSKLGEAAFAELMGKRPAGLVLHAERSLGNFRPQISIVPEATP